MKKFNSILFWVLIPALLVIRPEVFANDSNSLTSKVSFANKKQLDFKLEVPRRCMFGDYDAILQDMMWADESKSSDLVVSLLSINGEVELAKELFTDLTPNPNPDDIKAFYDKIFKDGYRFKVELPTLIPEGLYSLVVCKDSTGLKSCRGKQLREINDILSDYAKIPSKDFVSGDNIYFYQPVVLSSSRIGFANKSVLREDAYSAFLSEVAPSDKELLKTILPSIKLVNSESLSAENGSVTFKLPIYDPKKCQ